MRPRRLRPRAAAAAAVLAAAAAAAALAAGAAAAASAEADAGPASADGASHLAGMRLDGLTEQGHAVVIEFAAQGGGGADGKGRPAQPGRLALAGGMVWTESGPRPLGGGDAQVMVTGGGTVAVRSSDRPAVLFAVPEPAAGGGAAPARYTVTAYVPLDGGGLESASFDATLGPSGRGAVEDGGGEGEAAAPAAQPGGAEETGRLPDRLAVAVTVTERVQYGGTLVVQGRVYDADANAAPAVVPRGPGAVPGAPVQVTATDRRTGEAVLDWDGAAGETGLFRAEHRWGSADPASTLDIVISVDGGRAVEERTAFYLGFQDYRPREQAQRG